MKTFQIVRVGEEGNEEVMLNETSKTGRITLSIVASFKCFEGENAKLTSFTTGSTEVTVLGRGGVLTAAGKKML